MTFADLVAGDYQVGVMRDRMKGDQGASRAGALSRHRPGFKFFVGGEGNASRL